MPAHDAWLVPDLHVRAAASPARQARQGPHHCCSPALPHSQPAYFLLPAEFLHVKPGKGAAFVRSKLKNCLNGGNVEKTFRAGEQLQMADLMRREVQYTYQDGDNVGGWMVAVLTVLACCQDRLCAVHCLMGAECALELPWWQGGAVHEPGRRRRGWLRGWLCDEGARAALPQPPGLLQQHLCCCLAQPPAPCPLYPPPAPTVLYLFMNPLFPPLQCTCAVCLHGPGGVRPLPALTASTLLPIPTSQS